MGSPSILAVPCCEPGHGGGHLTRCISIVKDLRALDRDARLFLPQGILTEKIINLLQSMNFNSEWIDSNENYKTRNDELIVLDRFQTPKEEFMRWKTIAPVFGIDEGGLSRDDFDFLIDILIPEKMGKSRANIASPALLINKSESTRGSMSKDKQTDLKIKVLITFGHEDSAGLGLKTAFSLSALSEKYELDITLLRGVLAKNKEQMTINNVNMLDCIPNLSEHLGEYDIVITHYGITAYEALYAGTSVLLAHPTVYHKKLAKAAGFSTFNEKLIKTFFIKAKITDKGKNAHICKEGISLHKTSLLLKSNTTLADLINAFLPQVNRQCPVCGSLFAARCPPLVARFSDRTYRRCDKCGIIYMDRTNPPLIEYGKEYFFESYKNQYGKTYLEDFDNIKAAAKLRLNRIIAINKITNNNSAISAPPRFRENSSSYSPLESLRENSSSPPSLIDIGCAYGPFLAAAKEKGFSPTGIDPSEDAIRYVQEKLNIPAFEGFFPEISGARNSNDSNQQSVNRSRLSAPRSLNPPFDAVTLWFVIEHFKDCTTVLAEIKRILKPGGILAFSTPSSSGISGRKNPVKFFSASPSDHYTIWSPKICGKALAFAGFKLKKIVSAGHHPERFPLLGKLAATKKSPVYWLLLAISKIFWLGDTFEVYAQIKK